MGQAFDPIAEWYDQEFTDSPVGKRQRQCVWDYLDKISEDWKDARILELNCGTGADMPKLVEQARELWLSDISPEMINRVENKISNQYPNLPIQTLVLDLMDIQASSFSAPFDMIFSNFGGLNCISDASLAIWSQELLPDLIAPGGHLIAVLMPRYCLWESFYFLARGKFRTAFRRNTSGPVRASLGANQFVETWYHPPARFRQLLQANFKLIAQRPIGFCLPPSYMNPFFQSRPNWLNRLNRWEKRLSSNKYLAPFADHYLIHFQRI